MYNNIITVQCSSPVFLSISVVDQPDLDPQFVREFYSASVAEDAPQVCWGAWRGLEEMGGGERVWTTDHASLQGTSVLKVEAVDSDKGINDLMTYSISSENRGVPGGAGVREGVRALSEPLEAAALATPC